MNRLTPGVVFALILSLILISSGLAGVFFPTHPAQAQQINGAIAPLHSAALEVSHVFKATPGHVYQLSVSNATATAGFTMLFDAAAVPGTGTVAPVMCRAIPASGTIVYDFIPTPPAAFNTGIVAVVSSGANCTTYTTGVITAWFDALIQ